MKQFLLMLFALVILSAEVEAEDELPKKDESVAKEKLARDWLKYLEGEWDVEHEILPQSTLKQYTGGGDERAPIFRRRTQAKLVGKVLVIYCRLSRDGEWKDMGTDIMYWDPQRNELVEYRQIPPSVAERLLATADHGAASVVENPRLILKAMYDARMRREIPPSPHVFSTVQADALVSPNRPQSIDNIRISKSATGFVRLEECGIYSDGVSITSKDTFVRREAEKNE